MNKIVSVIVIAVLLTASMAGIAYLLANNNNDDKLDIEASLLIFGNANGDAFIDDEDIAIIQSIIDGDANLADHPLSDANQDGLIDEKDIEVVRKIIAGESTVVFYVDGVNEVSSVNFPLVNRKIALSSWQQADLVAILGLWNDVVGAYNGVVDSKSHYFPNTDLVYNFGSALDSEEELLECGADLIIASQGKKDEYNGYISNNPTRGIEALYFNISDESAVSTVLALGVLTLRTDLAHEYAVWAEGLKNKIANKMAMLDESEIANVVITMMYENQSTRGGVIIIECPGSGAGNMISLIANVYDSSAKTASNGRLNVDEEWFLEHEGKDYDYIIIEQEGTDVKKVNDTYYTPEMFNNRFEEAVEYYSNTSAYSEGKILGTTYSYSTYSGYAHLMYVAWMLYPDLFSEDEAWDALQEFYDMFTTATIDVKSQGGWYYTGTGYEAYVKRLFF